MAVSGEVTDDVFQPDPCAKSGDQVVQLIFAAARHMADLLDGQGFHLCGFQPHLIDAKAGLNASNTPFEKW